MWVDLEGGLAGHAPRMHLQLWRYVHMDAKGRALAPEVAQHLKVLRYQHVPKMAAGSNGQESGGLAVGSEKERLLQRIQDVKIMVKELQNLRLPQHSSQVPVSCVGCCVRGLLPEVIQTRKVDGTCISGDRACIFCHPDARGRRWKLEPRFLSRVCY